MRGAKTRHKCRVSRSAGARFRTLTITRYLAGVRKMPLRPFTDSVQSGKRTYAYFYYAMLRPINTLNSKKKKKVKLFGVYVANQGRTSGTLQRRTIWTTQGSFEIVAEARDLPQHGPWVFLWRCSCPELDYGYKLVCGHIPKRRC